MSEQAVLSARLIGEIFVERGLITHEQLESALEIQRTSGTMIGEVLVGSFGVSRIDLASVLADQWAAMERGAKEQEPPPLALVPPGGAVPEEDATTASSSASVPEEPRRPIGEIFVERGMATEEQLAHALELQRESGERLGEILVRLGVIGRLELAGALAEQWSNLQKLRPPEPRKPEPWNVPPTAAPAAMPVTATAADGAELAGLVEAVSTLQRQVSALASRPDPDLTTLRGEARELAQRLAGLEERVEGTPPAEEIASLAQAVAEVRESVEARPLGELSTAIDELSARIDELGRQDVHARVDGIEQQLAAVAALQEEISRIDVLVRAAASAEDVEQIARAIAGAGADGLAARLDELSGRLEAVTSRLDQEDGSGDGLVVEPGALDDLRIGLHDLHARLEGLSESVDVRLGATAEGLELVDELRTRTEASLATIAERVDQIEARFSAPAPSDERVEGIGADLARVADLVTDLDARVSDLVARDELAGLSRRLEERLDEAVRGLSSLQLAVAELGTEAAATELEPALQDLAARVDALGAAADSGRVDELARILGAVEERIATIDAAVLDVREHVGDREEDRARIETLAATIADLESRLDEVRVVLAGVQEHAAESDEADRAQSAVAALGEQLAHVQALAERAASVEELAEVRELAARAGDAETLAAVERATDDLRSWLDAVQVRLDTDSGGALSALRAQLTERMDAIAASVEDVRSTARDDGLSARLGELERALADASAASTARADEIAALRAQLETRLASVEERDEERRAASEAALGRADEAARQAEQLAATLDAAVARLRDELDGRFEGVAGRGEVSGLRAELESRLASVQGLDPGRVDALEGALAQVRESLQQIDGLASVERLEGVVHDLRAELDGRFEGVAGRGEVSGLRAELESRLSSVQGLDPGRVDALEGALAQVRESLQRIDGLASQERLENVAHDLRAELDGRLEGVARGERVDELAGALAQVQGSLGRLDGLASREQLDEMVAVLRAELDGRLDGVARGERVDELAGALAQVQGSLDALASEERLESMVGALRAELDGRLDGVARGERVDELAGALAQVQGSLGRLDGLASEERLDELGATVAQRLDVLEHRIAAAPGQGALDALVADLGERLAALGGVAQEASARAAAAGDAAAATAQAVVAERTAELVGREELEARLEHARLSSVEATAGLTASLDGVAAELRDGLAHLHGRLDELAAGLGHATGRLAAVEQAAADETAVSALAEEVEGLRARLDHDSAVSQERAAQTERAIRKGLAGLGDRLVAGEQAYLETGAQLRRAIERLGAAVVEADARLADEPLDPPALGYVAFLPTGDGYRLRPLDGVAPALDEVVQVEPDGPWYRVVRVTVSPLPLDRRQCVYFESA